MTNENTYTYFYSKLLEQIEIRKQGCWLWTGKPNADGYGSIRTGPTGAPSVHASKASWIVNVGPVPEGQWVLHKCDNPPCVRPSHLFLGSRQDNVDDMVRKGRSATGDRSPVKLHPESYRGERHSRLKLTEIQVLEIRRRRGAGEFVTALAREFGVAHTAIVKIAKRQVWKHI